MAVAIDVAYTDTAVAAYALGYTRHTVHICIDRVLTDVVVNSTSPSHTPHETSYNTHIH